MNKAETKQRLSGDYPSQILYAFQYETIALPDKLTPGTVSAVNHRRGMMRGEPLIVAMDALLSYARSHQKRYESPLSEDYVLGPLWLDSAKGIRGLLNGEMKGDCGTVESMFWAAMAVAGFTEADL